MLAQQLRTARGVVDALGGEGWDRLRDVALAADAPGFATLALMAHLVQIPQVSTAWEPIPEPWVTPGQLAGLDTSLRLGTLSTPPRHRATAPRSHGQRLAERGRAPGDAPM